MLFRRAAAAALLSLIAAAPQHAQTPADSAPPPCDGKVISGIDLVTQPPAVIGRDPSAWRRLAQRTLLMSSTTKPHVARAYLLARPGQRCSATLLSEAARVLRSQPYIGSASVTAVPDSANGVRLAVETFDEIPMLVSGAYRNGGISDLTVGNVNLLGNGFHAVVRWRDGRAYRDGLTLGLRQYGIMNRPMYASLDVVRDPIGDRLGFAVTRPFLSDLQRIAFHVGGQQSTSYRGFIREDGPAVSLPIDRDVWTAGAVYRIAFAGRGILLGPIAAYERSRPGSNAVIVSDSGLIPADTNVVDGRYPSYKAFRLGAAVGFRLLSYRTVQGFDALMGQQDIARGVQVGALLARGLEAMGGTDEHDFASVDLYTGIGTAGSFFGLRVHGEGERDTVGEWRAMVLSGRGAWYVKPSESRTLVASAEFAGAWRERLPVQLSLGDARAGVRGFKNATLAGGRRAVFRLEQRNRAFAIGNFAQVGTAFFGDVGNVWSGDVPFGETVAGRVSLGAGILVAAPPRSRKTIRADIAIPVSPGAPKRWLLRVAATDATRFFWRDPSDLAGVRAGAAASPIFGWP
jgi:hypothetical protein